MPGMSYPGTPQQPPIIPVVPPADQRPATQQFLSQWGPQYPPQQWMPPPAPPKKKGLPAWAVITIVLGSVAVLFLCAFGFYAIGSGIGGGPKPTVVVTSCGNDGIFTTMNYRLTNNDKKPHDYYVSGTVGHSPAIPDILENVQPGETASGHLTGTESGDCHIAKVDQR